MSCCARIHQVCGVLHTRTLLCPPSALIYAICHGFSNWACKTRVIAKEEQQMTFYLVNLTSSSINKVNVKHEVRIRANNWFTLGYIWYFWLHIVHIFTYTPQLSCSSISSHPSTVLTWFLFQASKNSIFWLISTSEAIWRLGLQDIRCFCKKYFLY